MASLFNFLLPSYCLFCGKLSARICNDCSGEIGLDPRLVFRDGLVGFSTSAYTDHAKQLLRSFKELGESSLGNFLAERMKPLLTCFDEPPTCLVPVPSNALSLRERGFNPAEIIARELCRSRPEISYQNLLARTRQTKDQSRLSPVQRAENQLNSMIAKVGCERVILIDDVITTGSTLKTAWKTLENSGHKVMGFLTFAETESKRCNLTTQAHSPADGGTSWN
jgi:ComF family protein